MRTTPVIDMTLVTVQYWVDLVVGSFYFSKISGVDVLRNEHYTSTLLFNITITSIAWALVVYFVAKLWRVWVYICVVVFAVYLGLYTITAGRIAMPVMIFVDSIS